MHMEALKELSDELEEKQLHKDLNFFWRCLSYPICNRCHSHHTLIYLISWTPPFPHTYAYPTAYTYTSSACFLPSSSQSPHFYFTHSALAFLHKHPTSTELLLMPHWFLPESGHSCGFPTLYTPPPVLVDSWFIPSPFLSPGRVLVHSQDS